MVCRPTTVPANSLSPTYGSFHAVREASKNKQKRKQLKIQTEKPKPCSYQNGTATCRWPAARARRPRRCRGARRRGPPRGRRAGRGPAWRARAPGTTRGTLPVQWNRVQLHCEHKQTTRNITFGSTRAAKSVVFRTFGGCI